MSTRGAHLHIVTDGEADLVRRRLAAIQELEHRYPKPESRRAMHGSLDRIARTMSGGRSDASTFPWEVITDEAIAAEVWRSVSEKYAWATARKDAAFLRKMINSCYRQNLMTFQEYRDAIGFEARGGIQPAASGRYLAPEDVRALVSACRVGNVSRRVELRDTALILGLASTGARRSELVQSLRDDIHLDERRVHLTHTKNGREREAWLHPAAARAMDTWLDVLGPTREAVFPALTRVGRPREDAPMSSHQVWRIIKRRADIAGLQGMAPHDLRRYVVSSLLSTHDLALVSRIVGHSDPTTTMKYDRRPAERMRAAVATIQLPSP